GGTLRFDSALGQHLPDVLPPGVFVAGSANGRFSAGDRAWDGQVAGERAAAHAGVRSAAAGHANVISGAAMRSPAPSPRPQSHPSPLFPSPAGKEFVDLDEDLTLSDLAHAAQEGF